MGKIQLEADVKGLGKVYRTEALFDEALESLRSIGIKYPITLRDLAYAKIKEGKNSDLSQYGSYVKEGIIYTPKQILFASESPILRNAKQATEAHRKEEEFCLDAKKYQEQAENDKKKEPEKRKVLISSENKNYDIPTNRFSEDELTLWAFKDKAKKYGEFLRDAGINELPIYFASKQEYAFARQLWLHRLGDGSYLDGNYWGLYCGDWVRGVLKESAEGTAKILPYTSKEIDRALKEGKLGISKLEKIISFLEKLKR